MHYGCALRSRQGADGTINEDAREIEHEPLGRAPREHHLPWDTSSILRRGLEQPVLFDDCVPGSVCGKGVESGFSRDAGTSGTAKTPNACGWCVAGKLQNGNANTVKRPIIGSGTVRRNESGENGGESDGLLMPTASRGMIPGLPIRRARGHAANNVPRFFAIVRAVTILFVPHRARRHAIAGTPAARRCVVCWIANVSG